MGHENGDVHVDQREVGSVGVKGLCLVWKKWETVKDIWEECALVQNLRYSHKKCERDNRMGQKEETLPGKCKELQNSSPVTTNGRDHFPRHLWGHLCVENGTCIWQEQYLYSLWAISSFPWVVLWVLRRLLACPQPITITTSLQCQYLVHKPMSSAHSYWPWPNEAGKTTHAQLGIGTTIHPYSLDRVKQVPF